MVQKAVFSIADKKTRRILYYILALTLYCAILNKLLMPDTGEFGDVTPWTLLAAVAITFGLLLWFIKSTQRREIFSGADWGLYLRKSEWGYMAFIAAVGIYLWLTSGRIAWLNAVGGLLIVLQITTYELVFRALLMNLLLKSSNKKWQAVIFAAFISALVYSAVLLPLDGFSEKTIGMMLALSLIFYYSRSIVIFIFFVASYAVPREFGIWVALFSIVLYLFMTLVLRLGVKRAEVPRHKPALLKPQPGD